MWDFYSHSGVVLLLTNLFQDLRHATKPTEYELILKTTNRDACVGAYERSINERTGEELIRKFERYEDGVVCMYLRRPISAT